MMLDHGMTEKIISPKAKTVIASTHFWVRVSRCSAPGSSCSRSSAMWSVAEASASSGSSKPTSEALGSLRTFAA